MQLQLAVLVAALAASVVLHGAAWAPPPVRLRSPVQPLPAAASPPPPPLPPAAAEDDPEPLDQRRLNRVRDCATTNKAELMRLLGSTRIFTRKGRARIDELVDAVSCANPVVAPSESTLLDGAWVGQGTSRRKQVIEGAQVTTTDTVCGGLFGCSHEWSFEAVDGTRLLLQQQAARVSVAHLNFNVPRRRKPLTTTVLYLDSDLQISLREGKRRPDIFLKGPPRDDCGQRQSPLRLRQRAAGFWRNIVDGFIDDRKQKTADPSLEAWGMIGTADLRETSPFQTNENLLEKMKAEAGEMDSGFSVDDLLSGRLRKDG